jgi:hypothetical protein
MKVPVDFIVPRDNPEKWPKEIEGMNLGKDFDDIKDGVLELIPNE